MLISDGTRLQVDQALAQGPQAKKGRARETEACHRRSKARQQTTAERITQFRLLPPFLPARQSGSLSRFGGQATSVRACERPPPAKGDTARAAATTICSNWPISVRTSRTAKLEVRE